MIKPFIVSVSDSTLEEIYNKIKNYPWKEMPNLDGWEYGSNLNYIKDFSKYWVLKKTPQNFGNFHASQR